MWTRNKKACKVLSSKTKQIKKDLIFLTFILFMALTREKRKCLIINIKIEREH